MVIRHHVQFELCVSGVFCASDASLGQRPPQAKPPVFFQDADPELGAMLHLVFCADRLDPRRSHRFSVHERHDLDLVRALGFLFQKPPFLFRIKTVFVRIRQQIVGFGVCGVKDLENGFPVRGVPVSQPRFLSVFQSDRLIVLHFSILTNPVPSVGF